MGEQEQFRTTLFQLRDASGSDDAWATAWEAVMQYGASSTDETIKRHVTALRDSELLSTWELVEILKRRSSVDDMMIAPYDNASVEVEGPACVLIITN